MKSKIKVALVGVGGYARNYVASLLLDSQDSDVQLIAGADPRPEASVRYKELLAHKIPLYPTIDAMFAEHKPDLAVISTPIQLHCEHTVKSLEHGAHVLCEKPLCASLDEVDRMLAARDRAKRQVGIGYQWSFARTFQTLKADIAAGVFGAPIRLSTYCCWPRSDRYYARNRWAGRITDDSGNPVLDSPVNNACAHSLNIMLFLIGTAPDRSGMPQDVTAELYRGNKSLQNYDTAAMRCTTREGVEVLFYTSHVTHRNLGPIMKFEFEKATVRFEMTNGKGVVAEMADGSVRNYGIPDHGVEKMWLTIDAIRSGKTIASSIEAASAQTHAVAAAQRSEIINFPTNLIKPRESDGDKFRYVEGLEEDLLRCFEQNKLPGELGMSWAKANEAVKVAV